MAAVGLPSVYWKVAICTTSVMHIPKFPRIPRNSYDIVSRPIPCPESRLPWFNLYITGLLQVVNGDVALCSDRTFIEQSRKGGQD